MTDMSSQYILFYYQLYPLNTHALVIEGPYCFPFSLIPLVLSVQAWFHCLVISALHLNLQQ